MAWNDEANQAYVVVGLVRTVLGETEVVGLLGRHLGELDAELTEMGSGNLLVEGLGEHARLVSGNNHRCSETKLTGHQGGKRSRWSRERSGPRSGWQMNKT